MRTRLTLSLSLSAAALAALPACSSQVTPATEQAAEQAAGPVAARTDAQPSEQDRKWMDAIHQGNLAEVEAGRLAQGKGASKRIKALGEGFVADHTALDTKVTQAAAQLDIQLPTSMTADQRKELDRLRSVSGHDFDQDFLAGMIKGHRQALAATKKEISKGSSRTVVSLAKAAAPMIRDHLIGLHKAQKG